MFDDIRYALRQFAKSPAFTVTAILTLALGIGATTAIFTLVYAILLKSPPVADPAGLSVWETTRTAASTEACRTTGRCSPGTLLSLVLRGAFLQVALGLALGIGLAALLGRAIASQLFGVKPYGPLILLITMLVLGVAAFLAAVIPARRAAGIEPMQALRIE